MSAEFSIGVIISGAISGAFSSAISGTRRTLGALGETTRRLENRQQALNRAIERYGQLGSRSAQRLNTDLQRVGRTLEQLNRQQKRLESTASMSDAARANRMALYGKGAETYALARTISSPVMQSVTKYASFESGLRDIAVTGDLDAKQEQAIGVSIRQTSLKVNQLQEELLGGVGQLVADGMAPEKASQFAELLGKAATATKADMTDLAKMTFAFSDALKITNTKDLEQAFGIAATGAKLGSFELKDMAKALPGLSKAFAARGITGKEAITQIVASLEVGKGSGSAEAAVTNMTNWLAAMGRRDTIHKYADAGIDYQGSMQRYVAQGFSQYEASLMIANRFIDGKGKAFLQQWQEAGAKGDQDSQQKLMESFGLAEIFTDIQTVNHLVSMRQGWDKYLSSKKEMNSDGAQNTLSKDFDKQNDTLEARWRRTQIGFNESSINIGQSLRPTLMQLAETFIPLIDQTGKWLAAHPELISNVVSLVGGFLAFKAASVGVRLGLNLLFSPIIDIWKGAMLMRTRWLLLRAAIGTGGRFAFVGNLLGKMASAARGLGKVLGGALYKGLMLAGRALLWIGRALLMNPIGLIIVGIAVAAYLIYRYWKPISNFFKGLWGRVRSAFQGGWQGIKNIWSNVKGWFTTRWNDISNVFNSGILKVGKLISNWSPLKWFSKAFSGVMKWFGIDMPNNFTDFGKNIVNGLVNGISNMLTTAKDTIKNFGGNISGWFKETLGIQSPSRVFMGFGDNIVQGAVMGIERTSPLAARATQRLAEEMTPDAPQIPVTKTMSGYSTGRAAYKNAGNSNNGFSVTYSPQIYIGNKPQTATPDISQALNMSLHELEKMLERIVIQRERRRYE
ncbi:phage tail tape measure protein [Xenorhabdus ehlersii]|uniref:Phage tail tape measure protein n=1 Tax=Xenorhabdus ehlersii TaxID=290111 RepID=A0A2D0IRV3_9GAMM|nr:phage tail tape measure protein [Xenorhabdus ehlersii]PHM24579.1 phage tail tape measure protein [Xenorhabdus ehlersii]RKE91218.1 TP901 family phage tail tape measure protein [Xenorhabdus ehlersii]